MNSIRRYFITGLLVWLPIAITLWVLSSVITLGDNIIPRHWLPQWLSQWDFPGFGLLISVCIVWFTGFVTANVIGSWLLGLWEKILARIPIVRTIYSSVKQVSDTLLAPNGQAFRHAGLIEYPQKGTWVLGLITGSPPPEISKHWDTEHISIYIPSTPNPTSGVLVMVPVSSVIFLDMPVDNAIKYIVSMGAVSPSSSPPLGTQ